MRPSTFLRLKLREGAFISKALLSTNHVVLAHIIPMRRCNLACGYCNEYDQTSKPVPLDVMKRRLDKLAEFGTAIITVSGGEPMMHPELDQIISHIRSTGAIAGLISNGYYFTPDRIKRLNQAGLDALQISIDNVNPDEVLSPERRRRYEFEADTLKLSSFDEQGQVTAVATWRRRP